VDDSPYLHKIIRAHFGPDPVIIHSAFDAEAGLTKAAGLQPSLILMDIDMPGVDGLEACRRLKANPLTSDTPVIFLTADCSTHDKVKAFELGAIDFITKPFQPDEVRARVRAALRTKAVIQQMVMIDSITGLWNQTYLDALLPAQLSLAKRTGQPLACIIADIDGLDEIYEQRGQPLAERIIKSITGTFAGMTRHEDVLCHLGGGRVLFLQPATTQAEAVIFSELMRGEIERQTLYQEFIGTGLTCSFGVADTKTQWIGSLVEAAEEAILQAKQTGNAVIAAPQQVDQSLAA
jgi:two-component system, cell cycle response regulator